MLEEREWRLLSLLDPHLVLLLWCTPWSTHNIQPASDAIRANKISSTVDRMPHFWGMGVAIVELARLPSRSPLAVYPLMDRQYSTCIRCDWSQQQDLIDRRPHATLLGSESGGCQACSTPISFSSCSVPFDWPTTFNLHQTRLEPTARSHQQSTACHTFGEREWWLSSLLDPHLVSSQSVLGLPFYVLSVSETRWLEPTARFHQWLAAWHLLNSHLVSSQSVLVPIGYIESADTTKQLRPSTEVWYL